MGKTDEAYKRYRRRVEQLESDAASESPVEVETFEVVDLRLAIRIALDRNQWKPIRANGKRECHVCSLAFRADPKEIRPCVAHYDKTRRFRGMANRWCPGGREPSVSQRRSAESKTGSIWAISGGLPTLGRGSR